MLGERHKPETHLIPGVPQAASGWRPPSLYGTDCDTPDGTCIHGYVKVTDLCDAHMRARDYIASSDLSDKFSLGKGHRFLDARSDPRGYGGDCQTDASKRHPAALGIQFG